MKIKQTLFLAALLLLGAFLITACNTADSTSSDDHMDHENMDDMEHEEMEDPDHDHSDHADDRIPNEGGAAIRIVSPADGDTFAAGEQVIVEVAVENFELGDNNHWHVYVDGTSWGMVMGGNADQPLNGLEPGEHEISVYLSIDTHEEYEDGDAITITVTE